MDKNVPTLLGTTDAAKVLGQTAQAVRTAIARGDLPLAAITVAGERLLSVEAIRAYQERRAADPRFAAARIAEENRKLFVAEREEKREARLQKALLSK
jgi:hypothetical protein